MTSLLAVWVSFKSLFTMQNLQIPTHTTKKKRQIQWFKLFHLISSKDFSFTNRKVFYWLYTKPNNKHLIIETILIFSSYSILKHSTQSNKKIYIYQLQTYYLFSKKKLMLDKIINILNCIYFLRTNILVTALDCSQTKPATLW